MDPTSQRSKVNGLLAKLPVNFDSVGVYTDPDCRHELLLKSETDCLGAFGAAASLESCTLTDLIFILDINVLTRLCDDKDFKREFTFPKCLTGLLEIFMEFLGSESDVEAAFVLLVFALVVECQARGPQSVSRILLEMRKETGLHWVKLPTNKKKEMSQQFCLQFLRRFLFIRAIVPVIRTRRHMIDFALDMVLKVLDCPEFHNKSLEEELLKEKGDHQVFQGEHQVFPLLVPKDDQLDPVAISLLIDVMADRNRSFSFEGIATTERAPVFASSVIDVISGKSKPFYEDTMLRWLIQRSVSEELDGRVIGKKSMNLKSLNIQHACIKLEVSGVDIKYFLATVGNKTLEEVGYGEKLSYHVHYEQAFEVETPASPAKPTEEGKSKRKRSNKSRPKGKSKRGGSKSKLASSCHEAMEKTLRLAHSESFEPVLNELKPRLREVREKLSARDLQRNEPKKRVVVTKKAAAAGKENEVNYRPTPQSEARVGKMMHRILVGHPDYLYKPLSSKSSRRNGFRRVSTLDLHGLEAEEARSKLDKCVVHWMEEAMVEYPFVTRVDIVCGGGAQVLADVVAEFIRRTPQVANRPKGLTVI